MNYRHSFHAGNFADVHKHIALVAILLHLRKKDAPFAVIDTHAGRGAYDLTSEEAMRTGEAASGVERLRSLVPAQDVTASYLDIVRDFGTGRYPGSPLLAAKLLRPQDRLAAIEKHPEEFAALARVLRPYARAHAVEADGYERLPALLPPAERRGLIVIDPPYEADDELRRVAGRFAAAYRRFSHGIYLLWFPLKFVSDVHALIGELQAAGASRLLLSTIDIGDDSEPDGRLTAAGLLVVNPPFELDLQMRAASAEILPYLRRGSNASTKVEWLSGAS